MTHICLIRHGETDWNVLGKLQGRTDTVLNDRGIMQAQQCTKHLKEMNWDVIITSPLLRAKQTAMILNEEIKVPLLEMEAFMERSFGDVEGMTAQKRMSAFPDRIYPNQEDTHSLNHRVMNGIEEINQRYGQSKVILVAHGAVISTILANLSSGEIGSGKTNLINGSLSNIHFSEDKWFINEFNLVTHLTL